MANNNKKKLVKCRFLGKGSYGMVYLAKPPTQPPHTSIASPFVAVKSAYLDRSLSLKFEGETLYKLRGCPEIIQCFGDDFSREYGRDIYNLHLEYAPGGNLRDLLKARGGKLPEWEVRWYAYKLLKGLSHIHEEGYVHCDIKPGNILVFSSPKGVNYLKMADFGLAKRRQEADVVVATGSRFRGTPLYNSPESVVLGKHKAPMDVWALGCTVIEILVTEKPMWSGRYRNTDDLICQIAWKELPDMPAEMLEDGKDFLRRCLARNQANRWTAEMLLSHPFISRGNFESIDEGRRLLALESLVGFGWVSSLSLFSVN